MEAGSIVALILCGIGFICCLPSAIVRFVDGDILPGTISLLIALLDLFCIVVVLSRGSEEKEQWKSIEDVKTVVIDTTIISNPSNSVRDTTYNIRYKK